MRARIYYTSGYYMSGYHHEAEHMELVAQIRAASGWEVSLVIEDQYHPSLDEEVRSYGVYAWIDDLEDLQRGIAKLGMDVIISCSPLDGVDIEIYDDYRE